jgi:hypothetical protein
MAVMIQMQFASAVTEIYEDAFVGSSMENGTTMIMFDLRKHDFHQELGMQAKLCWRTDSYHVDVHELSAFRHLWRNNVRYPVQFAGQIWATRVFSKLWRLVNNYINASGTSNSSRHASVWRRRD